MTRSSSDDNSVLLVHAYLDGELDPSNALGIAQQMDMKPALAAEGERVKALQRVIDERLPREEAPPGLRARIETSVAGVQTAAHAAIVARACGIHRVDRHGRQQLDLVRG